MAPNEIGWYHPTDTADQWDGFNEPGVEHFSGKPIQHLAREIVQNSLDAADGSGTVEVEFRHFPVRTSEIPDCAELRKNLQLCKTAAVNESKKAQSFFEEAFNLINRERISVLQVSDYYTKGMVGPAENGTPYYAFMKAKGQSRKIDNTATGSFGIGKFAPYAVSKLRTIFVSTIYEDKDGHYHQLTQGKSILMSHDESEERKQGVGFWGIKLRCQPVNSVGDGVPTWIQRAIKRENLPELKGSTLSILGFEASQHWDKHIAVSVAENFFGAIFDGRLRVVIGDHITLDKTTIERFFSDDSIIENIKRLDNEPEFFQNCRSYLAAHSKGVEVIVEESEQTHLGLCELRLFISEGLPKKVCILRNGMFITDSLAGLKRLGEFKDFVAVFHCQSNRGNELLRAMEPPRHDDFEPARLTKEDQQRGKNALKELSQWVREKLKRHAKDPVSEVSSLDELRDLFGDEGAGDGNNGNSLREVNPYGSVVIRAKPIRPRSPLSGMGLTSQPADGEGDELGDEENRGIGGGGATGGGGGDGQGGTGQIAGDGTGGNGTGGLAMGRNLVDVDNVRAIVISNTSRRVAFTPFFTGLIRVELREAGADSDYPLPLSTTSSGVLSGGSIELEVKAAQRVVFEVTLTEPFTGALKVVAHEVR